MTKEFKWEAQAYLGDALDTLVSGVGRIKERLRDAFLEFHCLQPEHFPHEDLGQTEDELKTYAEIQGALTAHETFENTLAVMSEDEASSIAAKVLKLYLDVVY